MLNKENVLIGKDAKKICESILHDNGLPNNGKYAGPKVCGYFIDADSEEDNDGHITAFDNTNSDMWVEDFETENDAREWLELEPITVTVTFYKKVTANSVDDTKKEFNKYLHKAVKIYKDISSGFEREEHLTDGDY